MHYKKHISLIIAFFLLVSNSGLAFNVHFCEGKIASISSVFTKEEVCETPIKEEKTCCYNPKTEHKKCCSDREVNLKAKTEKSVVNTISFDLNSLFYYVELETIRYNLVKLIQFSQIIEYCYNSNAPPFYKLYCQFTFYA
ncbi:hypothetical protein [Flavobacterium sp.]|uniref:HYC_CC_PP family protein n=1 Tax=Flavobacterium sp. TaxID=239 RepID=UPI003752D6FB